MLVDLPEGKAYHLDGLVVDMRWGPAYDRLDATVISPSGNYAVIYETLGTKGAVIKLFDESKGTFTPQIIREINRDSDNAEAFEYPVLLFRLPDGREAIAHCPDKYDHFVIEDLTSGKRLVEAAAGFPHRDYYYSKLATNPSNTHILSTGWAWDPCTEVVLYDIKSILDDPRKINQDDAVIPINTEASSAAFVGNDKLIITSDIDPAYIEDDAWLQPGGMLVYDIISRKVITTADLKAHLGTMLPINSRFVVEFYEHPKLIDIEEAEIIHRWEDIDSGKQESSIIWHIDPIPPIALDFAHQRFAVSTGSSIRVVEFSID